jgi:hypothetical protein
MTTPSPFNASRRADRDLSELLGLAKGVMLDGVVTENEAIQLRTWIANHPDVVETWPGDILSKRLEKIFADGKATPEECADLAKLLGQLVGGEAGIMVGKNASTTLPIDQPPPKITLRGKTFVLTGTFALGPRSACEKLIESFGGQSEGNVTGRTDFLVVGTFASRDWAHTSYGRKIELAIEKKKTGQKIASLPKG